MLKKIAVGLLSAFYVFLFIHFRLWDFFGDRGGELFSKILAIVTLVVLLAGMWGAAFERSWARRYLIAGNIIYLGFGGYVVHFRWTLWLFEEPTLTDRIRDTAPCFLLGVVFPVVFIFLLFRMRRK